MTETVETSKLTERLYKSNMRSWTFFFPDGSPAIFYNHMYWTEDEWKIAQLDSEIRKGHPNLSVDKDEMYYDKSRHDPIAALRRTIAAEERAKVLAEIARATNPARDLGTYEQQELKGQSTTGNAAVVVGGSDPRLMELSALQAQLGAA